ncbi:MAG TPA: Asp-tRNA(Asn)/Glu-tRNA(Gln) amidotransferase subunit GatC [Methanoregulaceae archaeon]|nr:Asp-tRNA(Asn)/Glu-tRNA(Gln) amidotransferase subunit GatC [Methanoregulaceae archaeon]
MISERDVKHIAELADIGISGEELDEFTVQFNDILDYFDILDQVEAEATKETDLYNVFREDVVTPSLPQEEVLCNAGEKEDGFFRAPRVM